MAVTRARTAPFTEEPGRIARPFSRRGTVTLRFQPLGLLRISRAPAFTRMLSARPVSVKTT